MTDLIAGPVWLAKGFPYIGFHETGNNQGIEHFIALAHTGELGDAWCAIYLNGVLEESGVRGTRSPAARSFMHDDNFVKLGGPALGAISVFWRGSPDADTGHVGFYLGENDHGIVLLEGNANDQVERGYVSPDRLLGYYWPKSVPLPAIGKITASISDPLPTVAPVAQPVASSSGKGSWYSQYQGTYSWVDTGDAPNSNALGVPDDHQGCSFYNHATLGQWFDVTAPNGVTLRLQQTDIGPSPRTGRLIDISAVAAERFGYTPRNFPTDGVFTWSPATGAAPSQPQPQPEPTPVPTPAPAPAPAPFPIDQDALKEALHTVLPQVLQGIGVFVRSPVGQKVITGGIDKLLLSGAGLGAGPIGIIAVAVVSVLGGVFDVVSLGSPTGVSLLSSAGAVTGLGLFSKLDQIISSLKARQ